MQPTALTDNYVEAKETKPVMTKTNGIRKQLDFEAGSTSEVDLLKPEYDDSVHHQTTQITKDHSKVHNEGKIHVNVIPKSVVKEEELQNSAPQNTSRDCKELSHMHINDPKTYRAIQDERLRSFSNDTRALASKHIVS